MSVVQAVQVCLALLSSKNPVTDQDILDAVNNACMIYSTLTDADKEQIICELTSKLNVWVGEGAFLKDKHEPWLNDRSASVDWHYWNRYRRFLEVDKAWSPSVTSRLHEITDKILGFLEDPERQGPWDRRGMVVGEVQSGKTANYTGLICKAIDSGYKVIIVLAGLHNSLRSQTQVRLEHDCVGRDTSDQQQRVGVGRYQLDSGARPIHLFTSSHEIGDFGGPAAKTGFIEPGSDPVLMVIKKNVSVLNNVLRWAKKCGQIDPVTKECHIEDIPLLLIDDEADNASIDGRQVRWDQNGKSQGDDDPTAINRKIRELLKIFRKSAYVGYTATPFANIFIYPNDNDDSKYGKDLFPESFILNLHSPSNYIGPVQLFGLDADDTAGLQHRDMMPIVQEIDDYEKFIPDKHKKEHNAAELPDSLKRAIRSFIITAAVRTVRGQEKAHNSMLIHVTRFNDVQTKVRELVFEEVDRLQRELRYSQGKDRSRVVAEFSSIWEEDYVPISSALNFEGQLPGWPDVEALLSQEASRIIVRTINGSVGDILDYQNHQNGLRVIAVGGDKLSRGLTLEGLTVSYYLRASKMYDTLMQMGRWFGYRPGYLDLCRIYTSGELIRNYRYIALANEELRTEFDLMAARGQTPREYGLKVRTHPEGLQITATNKLRNGTNMKVSFSQSLVETASFHRDKEIAERNKAACESWVRTLGQPIRERIQKNYIWQDVKADKIIEFLNGQRVHPLSRKADPSLLSEYIRKRQQVNELTSWTVALIHNSTANPDEIITIADNLSIGLTHRSDAGTQKTGSEFVVRNRHLISEREEMIDCPEDSDFYREALYQTVENWKAVVKKRNPEIPAKPIGHYIRSCRSPQNGLLLIYHIDPKPIIDLPAPAVIGFAVSFPKTAQEGNEAVEYKVSTDYWRILYGEEDDD